MSVTSCALLASSGRKTLRRWFTDFMIKCHVAPNELYVQVGNVTLDHAVWGRPEELLDNMPRPAFKITPSAPGADVAGNTAAALAAASMVFATVDANYSSTLLSHARQLHDFAMNYPGLYSDVIPIEESYSSDKYALC